MSNSQIKVFEYTRKSTEGDDRQVLSLSAQHDENKKIIDANGLKVVKLYKESLSASKPNHRPLFNEMIENLRAGKANGIVCWQLNRLSRNPQEHGIIQQLLQDGIIQAIYTHDRTYRPEDNALLFSVESGMSNQFIQELKSNVKRGMKAKNKLGGINGVAPQGYLNDRLEKTIVPDPKNFPLVRKAFDMYLTGKYAVPEIIKTMNEDWGFLTTKHKNSGNKPISRNTFYNMLKNPIYKGYVADFEEEGVLHKGSWEPMISEEEFDRIQLLLGLTKNGNPRNLRPKISINSKHFELKGLFHCGSCGCSITAELKKKTLKNGSVEEYIYYHCTHKRKGCTEKGCIREEKLYEQIYAILDSYSISEKLYTWGLEIIKDIQAKEIAERNNIQDMQSFKIEQIRSQLKKLLEMATKSIIEEDEYEAEAKKLKKSLADMEQARIDYEERNKNWCEIVGKTLNLLQNPNNRFDSTTCIGEKRSILQSLGYNHIITDKKISFTPYPWIEEIQKASKNSNLTGKKVITDTDRIKNGSKEPLFETWYARRDSNPRPNASKASTLIQLSYGRIYD